MMRRKFMIVLGSALLLLSGCSKKEQKAKTSVSVSTARPKESEEASQSPEPVESTAPAEKSAVPEKTAAPAKAADQNTPAAPAAKTPSTKAPAVKTPAARKPAASGPVGTWQIISYDNGSGSRQTFNPGKDSSIIGSSSIVLNQDGSCEFNLPGLSSEGCTWQGTQIHTNGAQVTYAINGNQMTVNNAGGVYVFQKRP